VNVCVVVVDAVSVVNTEQVAMPPTTRKTTRHPTFRRLARCRFRLNPHLGQLSAVDEIGEWQSGQFLSDIVQSFLVIANQRIRY
jgi:hypothetical protein